VIDAWEANQSSLGEVGRISCATRRVTVVKGFVLRRLGHQMCENGANTSRDAPPESAAFTEPMGDALGE
jgi:hypothetical protein